MAKVDFGKWEVIDSLGEGGQAHTFNVRAKGDTSDQAFVLKRLKNTTRLERFRKEVDVGLALAHPNLIRIIDHDLEAAHPFLVTELCTGGPLSNSDCSKRPLLDNLRTFQAICDGVAFAHRNNVIHRDLKPDNIFLRNDGTPVVGDFGICFIEDGGARFTITEEAVGPRNYMAPELEDGRAEVRYAADVYSLGKLLYWMLAGRIFAREKHCEVEFDLRRTVLGSAIHIVYELLDQMIVNDWTGRIRDAGDVVTAIAKVIDRIERHANVIDRSVPQYCFYCGIGSYEIKVEYSRQPGILPPNHYGMAEPRIEGSDRFENLLGFGPRGDHWLVMVCGHCGNLQMFRPDLGNNPDIWRPKRT